jgi:hypothetical protein
MESWNGTVTEPNLSLGFSNQICMENWINGLGSLLFVAYIRVFSSGVRNKRIQQFLECSKRGLKN